MSPQEPPVREDILIVDDTPANLRLLSQMLTAKGYRVRAVTSGARALESIRATPPGLILLDVRMPEMSGYEVCEALKADEQARDIPVIFISALDDLQDKVRAFRAGGVDYITKPFQHEEVLVRTETHLALRRLQKQLQEANRKLERELALAGQMQASFLPRELPNIPGWQLSAVLKPARETSGDFYDLIPLPSGRWGILIADVVDKGAGAALYMALSWSLMRTYTATYPIQPAQVFEAVNRRLLADTGSVQFVTVFYGILDPTSGQLMYCNAGQCPPFHVGKQGVHPLIQTGPPLGLFEDQTWGQRAVRLAPGDVLALYTDGITEAEDLDRTPFGADRLQACVRTSMNGSARQVQDCVLSTVEAFADSSYPHDDIALVVLVREPRVREHR